MFAFLCTWFFIITFHFLFCTCVRMLAIAFDESWRECERAGENENGLLCCPYDKKKASLMWISYIVCVRMRAKETTNVCMSMVWDLVRGDLNLSMYLFHLQKEQQQQHARQAAARRPNRQRKKTLNAKWKREKTKHTETPPTKSTNNQRDSSLSLSTRWCVRTVGRALSINRGKIMETIWNFK